LTGNGEGVLFAYVTDSIIENVSVSANLYGMRVFSSSGIIIAQNLATNNWVAIHMTNSSNTSLSNNIVDSSELLATPTTSIAAGISLDLSKNITILNNVISNHNFGSVHLSRSNYTVVRGNTIVNDRFFGIGSYGGSRSNLVIENRIENSAVCIWMRYHLSNNITVYHNNFINNSVQVDLDHSRHYVWDNGREGNYWSDYENRYPNATEIDGLGVWDVPYRIDENNTDRYPLKNPYWNPSDVNHDLTVGIDDIVQVAEAFGAYPGHERWVPTYDVNNDGQVNIVDIIRVARDFGARYL
jgi:parallel beta-helix repeat protein